jgi:hypothetical protein
MHEEVDHTKEQEEEHAHHAQEIEEEDEPHLDLERGWEMEAYHLVKDREFNHMPMYDVDFLEAIGMDTEFISIWKAVGWENIDPIDELGSRLLTIQFLCSLRKHDEGISFRLFQKQYFCTWRDLATHIGFNTRCKLDLDPTVRGFDCHKFWAEISGLNVIGKFSPLNMNIQHPTLRFMHHWIAMTLFLDLTLIRSSVMS